MKKADLDKNKGLKIAGKLAQSGTPPRYGSSAASAVDRRERRRLDQAAGLVPFATKLPATLIAALNERALERGVTVGELVSELLGQALAEATQPESTSTMR